MTILAAFAYERFGRTTTHITGSMLLLVGSLGMWATVHFSLGSPEAWLITSSFVLGQGGGWLYTVALNANVGNFRAQDYGKILGILTCSFALCGGVFTQVYKAFFRSDEDDGSFLLFLAVALPILAA